MHKGIFTLIVALALLLVPAGIKAQAFSMSEGFESWTTGSSSAPAAGWDKQDYTPGIQTTTSTSYLWYVNELATTAHGGTKYAYLYAYHVYTSASRLKTPAYVIPSSGDYRLSFWLKNHSTAGSQGDFTVYYSLDSGATYLNNPIPGLQHISTGNVWTEYDALLPDACKGQSVTLVFEGASGNTNSYYYYLDDIAITLAPTCWTPTNLSISNLTGNSANFGWNLVSKDGVRPDQFSVTLKDNAGDVVYYNAAVPYDTTSLTQQLSFTGLQTNTTYTVSVRSNCVASYHGFSDSLFITFTTLASAINPPLFQNFDSLTTATFPGTGYYIQNATLNTNASYSHSGANSLQLTTTASGLAYFIFPMMNLVADNFEVDLWIRRAVAESTTIGPISYKIGYLTDPSNIANLVPIHYGTLSGDVSWREIRLNSYDPNIPDSTTPVMIAIQVDAGVATSIYVDDVDIHVKPTCTRPENLTVSNMTDNSAVLAWSMANATSFNVRAMAPDSTYVTATAAGSPFTMTGLASNTQYEFSVQGVCSATDITDWAVAAIGKTYCAVADSTLFFEGAEGTSSAAPLPECWTTGYIYKTTTATTDPFYSGTASKIGTRAFALRKITAGSIAYLCTQALNFDTAGKYSFRYKYYRALGSTASYNGEGIKVFVTQTPGDTTNAVEVIPFVNRLSSFAPSGAIGWNEYEGVINYQGIGYIMFVGYTKNGAAAYFDNLEVFLSPTCPKVSKISMTAMTTTSARVKWNPGSDETQWIVNYELKSGNTVLADTTVITNAANYTIGNLESATQYTVSGSVRALCGVGDTAEAVAFSVSFKTLCPALDSLPYTTDFENEPTGTSAAFVTCWQRFNDASGTTNYFPYNYSSATYATSGSNSLYFYSTATTTYAEHQMAILPEIDKTIYPINNLRLKFWAKRSTTTSHADAPMIIGVMSDPSDITTFVAVDTLIVNTTSSQQYVIEFSSYTGNGTYIAIRLDRQSSACYCYLDDVTLEEIPHCTDLSGSATVSNVTENSVRITLADATASSSWSFAYGVAGTPVADMTAVDTMGGMIVLNNLASATNYDFYVRRNCGNGIYSPWTEKISFATLATPAQAPYVCGFEDAAENAKWMYVDGASTSVFAIGQASSGVYAGTNGMYVTIDRTTAAHTYNTGAATKAYAYRTIHFDAKGYQVEMKVKSTGGESYYDFGRILLTSTSEILPAGTIGEVYSSTTFPNAIVEFDENFVYNNCKMLNCSTYVQGHPDADGWVTISYIINMIDRPGNYNLVFMWNSDVGGGNTSYPLAVDDISITELSCIPPENVVTSVGSTSLDITVTQAVASQWEFVIDSVAFTKDAVPANPKFRISSTDGHATATGLTPNTQYWYSVRTICGTNDTSAWLDVESVRTFCAPYNVPHSEGFENIGAANCWTLAPAENDDAAIARVTSPKRTGLGSITVTKATAVSPEFNVDSLTHYMINGWAYSTTDNATFSVGVITNPNDGTTFEPIASVQIPVKNKWTEFTAYFTDLMDLDYQDFKYAKHIALATGDNTISFDDLIIDLTPSCPMPTNVSITNVTANSFDISFTDHANANQWVVYLNEYPYVIDNDTATISGLVAHKTYNVEIAAICSATDTSYTTDCGTVTTLCGPMSTPWNCGFEVSDGFVGGTSHSSTTNLTVNVERNCWNVLNNRAATAISGTPYAYVSTNASYVHTGSQCVYTNSSTSGKNLCLIFPEFTDSVNMLRVKFWYKTNSTADNTPQPKFGYFTDATSDTSFVLLEDITRSTTWTEKEILTNNASYNIPANARLGIKIERGAKSGVFYLDDISVTLIRNCSDPDAPTVSNVTASTAEVSFIDTCTAHTAWEYVYGRSGFNPYTATPTAITAKSFNITGLDDDTKYEVYVRAVCGVGDVSNYFKASFKTHCVPFHVTAANPFVEDFNNYDYNQYFNSGTCYTVLGEPTNKSYWAKTYPATAPSATATTYYFYGHSADRYDKCLYWSMSKNDIQEGTVLRLFHLDGGTTYEVSAWVHTGLTTSYHSKVSGLVGASVNALDTMISQEVDGSSVGTRVIDDHTTYPYNELYEEIKYFVTPDSTGDYYLGYSSKFNTTYASNYLYLDDWTIVPFTGCASVIPSLDSITAHEAYISIDDTTAYQFEYVLNDTTRATTVINTTQFVLNNLNPSTTYTLYLRKHCDATNVSQWVTLSFLTECAPIQSLPYFNDFENEVPGTNTTRTAPVCWSQFNDATGDYNGFPYVNTYSDHAHSGYKALRFYVSTTASYANHTISILPEVDITLYPINTLRLKFWAKRSATTSDDDAPLIIGVMSDPADISTFVSAGTLTVDNFDYQQYTVSLANYSGNGKYVAIRFDRQASASYCFIDDVTLEEIPACEGPENAPAFVSSTMTTLTVSADMAGKDTIEFGIAPALSATSSLSIDTTILSTDGIARFTGLASSTNYAIWHRYYCGVHGVSAWSLAYATGATTASDCFAPQNLHTVGVINDHHAEITWGRAPEAVAYEYELKHANSIVAAGAATADTLVFDSLMSNSSYTIRVRSFCAADTTAWTTLNFMTTRPTFSLPFICDFENVAQNNGWIFNTLSDSGDNTFIIGNGTNNGGQKALYVSADGATYSYATGSASVSDAEVLLEMPAGNYSVSYDWQCEGENTCDYGRVFLMPASTALSGTSYTAFASSLPTGAISLEPNNGRLNLSDTWTSASGIYAVPTTGVYKLVVLWADNASGGAQPPMAIDNIRIERVTCMPVSSVSITATSPRDAEAAVVRHDASVAVEYALSQYGLIDSVSAWTVATNDTLSFTGLVPDNEYTLFVRHACDSASKSPVKSVSFTTPNNAVGLPFVATFEADDTINSYWTMTSGTALNWYTIGSAASASGTRSLYVTDDGYSHHYTNGVTNSYAYIPVEFTAGIFDVSYQWYCHGEGNNDYGHLFLAPSSMIPEDNVLMAGMSGTSVPAGTISLNGNYAKLNSTDSLNNVWFDGSVEITIENAGTYNLIVAWHNDGLVNHQPPFAIDNIRIKELTCPKPDVTKISVDSASTDMVRLKIAGMTAGKGIIYHVASDDTFSDTVAAGVVFDSLVTVTGLAASTWYSAKIGYVCSVGDTSSFVNVSVRTNCAVVSSFPYHEDFESYASSSTNRTELTDNCWSVAAYSTGTTQPYHYMTTTSSYVHGGTKALCVYNAETTGSHQTFALPKVDTLAGKQLSMWYKNYNGTGAGAAVLKVGYLTNPDDLATFTNLMSAPVSTSEYKEIVVNYPATIPAGARPAFKADGTNYLLIDDIHLNKVVQGQVYYDTICFGYGYSNHGFACAAGTLAVGDTLFNDIIRSTVAGVADSSVRVNLYVRPEINNTVYDTVCPGVPYSGGMFNIPNPTTDTYFQTFTSVTGCDSVVSLHLYVLPATETIYDTICEGDAYQFGTQTLTQSGTYYDTVPSGQGCNIVKILNLYVVTTETHQYEQVCSGASFAWEGQTYTQAGTYTKTSVGAHDCTLTKYLHLTVMPTDSTVTVSFCQGGSVQVADTVITTAGSHTFVRLNQATGCSTTYHVTATETQPTPEYVNDEVCEGKPYNSYGVSGVIITQDTTITQNTRTADGLCDSVIIVNVKLNPTTYGQTEYIEIDAGDAYTWHDSTYTASGVYYYTTTNANGCDSICTLNLTVGEEPPVAVEDVQLLNISLIPNPVNAGETSFIYGNFTNVKSVEILNSFGQVIDTFVPHTYPIEVQSVNTSGVYYVRVTTEDDQVAVEKLIVK